MSNPVITSPGIPFTTFLEAALYWYRYGFRVIPLIPGTKKTAVKWDIWLAGLSTAQITAYWTDNPDHELGFIVDGDILVLDADSPESLAALALIEQTFDLAPQLVNKTAKGVHHYFRLTAGTSAKSDSHSTVDHPERIDVKAKRSMVVLPPSTGKEIQLAEAENATELTEATQEFINAIDRHNGRQPYRPAVIPAPPTCSLSPSTQKIAELKAMLSHTKRNLGYIDWLNGLMAICHETGGSAEGFEIADSWSQTLANYKDRDDVMTKWKSFKLDTENPITVATIRKMVTDNGGDWMAICDSVGPQFEPCDTVTVYPGETMPAIGTLPNSSTDYSSGDDVTGEKACGQNPLVKYSLLDKLPEVENMAVDAIALLGQLVLMGQFTFFFAAANTGKTLLVIYLLIQAILQGRVDASRVFYLDMDDNSGGVLEKLRIAVPHGFHILAGGYQNFSVRTVFVEIAEMINNDQALGVIIILDTYKKFANVMDKTLASKFNQLLRRFVMKGGTVIALAHTNKNPDANGRPVFGGTSDTLDDCDCAYTLRAFESPDDPNCRIVEFDNIKRRGSVAQFAAYSYSTMAGITYNQLLASVKPVDDAQFVPMKQAATIKSDAELIDTVTSCIEEGINTKMLLRDDAAKRLGVSKTSVLDVIHKYTGDDPATCRWQFTVRDRGAKVYALLNTAPPESDSENTQP